MNFRLRHDALYRTRGGWFAIVTQRHYSVDGWFMEHFDYTGNEPRVVIRWHNDAGGLSGGLHNKSSDFDIVEEIV